MRPSVFMVCVLWFLAACAAPPVPEPAPSELADERELIVLTAEPQERLIGRATTLNYTVKAVYPLTGLDDVLVVFRIPDGRTIPEAIAEIEADLPEVTAGAHHLYRLQANPPAVEARAYADNLIGWPSTGCAAVRKIGMLDDGVLPAHPGLSDGRIIQERFVDGDEPPATDHGSLMADLLIGPGRVTGATLYSANVVDPIRERGDTAGVVSILRGIDWLQSRDVDLVNLSLAGPRNKLLDRGLGTAAEKGMTIVAAAGNRGPSAPPQYPAAFPFVLAATAIDRERNVYERAITGAHIDISAPGVELLVPMQGRLRVLSGTSFAAPFVTAVVAVDPDLLGLHVDAVRERLQDRAVDLGRPGPDPVFGAGLVRAPDGCYTG